MYKTNNVFFRVLSAVASCPTAVVLCGRSRQLKKSVMRRAFFCGGLRLPCRAAAAGAARLSAPAAAVAEAPPLALADLAHIALSEPRAAAAAGAAVAVGLATLGAAMGAAGVSAGGLAAGLAAGFEGALPLANLGLQARRGRVGWGAFSKSRRHGSVQLSWLHTAWERLRTSAARILHERDKCSIRAALV